VTLILACSWGGKAAIASDSHGSDSYIHRDYGKKWERMPFGAIGWSGTYEWFPAVRKGLQKINSLRTEADRTAFLDAMEEGLKAKGWKRESEKGLPTCESVLGVVLSSEGKCWELYGNLILYPCRNIAAVGCGAVAGIAAAEALRQRGVNPVEACRQAVRITIGFVPGVKGTAHVLRVK
jgi:ATP-dependent protease HslVU (ClpYQ) peptidase subunit